jgi:phage gp29-like protein
VGIFASLSGMLARAVGRRAMTERVGVVDELPLWFNPGRIGGELTPRAVSNIFAAADQGHLWQLVDLFDESRQKDCHLHAVLSTFELALALLEVQVVPASPRRRDLKIAAWVESFLRSFGSRVESDRAYDLSTLISHLAGGYTYSHAVAEVIWEKRGLELVPIGAEPIMPRRFLYDQATSELHFDVSGFGATSGIHLPTKYPNRFVQFRPRVTGAIASREGLIRPLTWAALFRNWTVKDWLALAELAWKPWRIGKYKKDEFASDKDIAALENALQYLVTNGATMLPDTVALDVVFAKSNGGQTGSNGGGAHGSLAAFLAAEMSKAVLGQTMTTEDGSSLSQAQVHRKVQNDRRNAAARAIASVLQRQLVAAAVRLNFGADAAVPSIHLAGGDDVDLAALAQAIERLVRLGLPVSIPWIYKLYGMPTPKTGEAVIGNPVPALVPAEADRARIARMRIASEGARIALPEPGRVRMLEGDDLADHLDAEAEAEARAIEDAQRRRERRRAAEMS